MNWLLMLFLFAILTPADQCYDEDGVPVFEYNQPQVLYQNANARVVWKV